MAPILYARANTVGEFTDVPMLMWYEMETTSRGWRLRYSVVFSNEDGGTATDRLMATWGRTTDIEYVYGVEVDDARSDPRGGISGSRPRSAAVQGTPRRRASAAVGVDRQQHGQRVGHDAGALCAGGGAIRPGQPVARSRDGSACLDLHRGGAGDDARGQDRGRRASGIGKDSRSAPFRPVEACTELENAARRVFGPSGGQHGAPRWYDSDRGLSEFRIVRSGCFRGAVPLPASAGRPEAVRFRAFSRAQRGAAPASSSVVLTRVNTVFTLDERYQPGRSLFSWTGSIPLPVDGDWRELPF